MFKGVIYIHKNKLNGKCYVGQTIRKPQQRWGINGNNYKKTPKFFQAIQKYGWNNFEHIILPQVYHNQDELNQAEKDMIAELDSFNNGYNLTEGGCSSILTKETIEKIRKKNLGRKQPKSEIEKRIKSRKNYRHSQETKQKISKSNEGKKHSFETKQKLSNYVDKETKQRLYEARKEKYKPLSEEHKSKISLALKGREISEEQKQKLSLLYKGKSRKELQKQVIQLDKNGNKIKTWDSIKEAKKELKIEHIGDCCNGKRKTAGNFVWKFI